MFQSYIHYLYPFCFTKLVTYNIIVFIYHIIISLYAVLLAFYSPVLCWSIAINILVSLIFIHNLNIIVICSFILILHTIDVSIYLFNKYCNSYITSNTYIHYNLLSSNTSYLTSLFNSITLYISNFSPITSFYTTNYINYNSLRLDLTALYVLNPTITPEELQYLRNLIAESLKEQFSELTDEHLQQIINFIYYGLTGHYNIKIVRNCNGIYIMTSQDTVDVLDRHIPNIPIPIKINNSHRYFCVFKIVLSPEQFNKYIHPIDSFTDRYCFD